MEHVESTLIKNTIPYNSLNFCLLKIIKSSEQKEKHKNYLITVVFYFIINSKILLFNNDLSHHKTLKNFVLSSL